jgi:asparagine synthase (glutamine-hydrolysing)
MSDVPLGAFLSGGVDSGTTVALMAQISNATVKTYSIGFEDEAYNELPLARQVAERYGTDHHEFIVRPDAAQILPDLVWHYNEPFADSSAIPTYYLSKLTRQHVTVALNGDAGDENFAGYRRYITPAAARRFDALPARVRRAVSAAAERTPMASRSDSMLFRGRRWLRRVSDSPVGRYEQHIMILDHDVKGVLCQPSFLKAAGGRQATRFLTEAHAASDAPDFVDSLLDMDVNRYLPDCLLVKVDIATMAHGLEGRSPMLDHVFMEYAASLPSSLKLKGQTTKYILKRVARDLIPAEIIDRPKRGFSVPMRAWMQHDLREMCSDLLLSPTFAQRGYFNQNFVSRMLDEHWRGVASWQNQLWSLLMFELWHRTFIDSATAARRAPRLAQAV